jgi:hypothetical protein
MKSAKAATPARLGCLVTLASPFLIFGLIMLGMAYGQVMSGAAWGALKYGVGSLIGLTIGTGIIRGRNIEQPARVSRYAPFALYYALGGLFALIGVAVLGTAADRYQAGADEEALGYGVVAVILLIIGALIMIGGRIRTRRERPLVEALMRGDPEPWRYVPGWADGKVRDSGVSSLRRGAATAVVANLVAWPLAIGFAASPDQPLGALAPALWLLPLAAVVSLGVLLLGVRRRARYGGMTFTMDPFPGVIGGALTGNVWARTDLQDAAGANLTAILTSVRRVEDMNSDSRVHTQRLSEQRQTVAARFYEHQGARYLGIPVSFDIPLSAAPTTLDDPGNKVIWQLEIDSDIPSLPARSVMEVPVFDLRSEAERAQEVPELGPPPTQAPVAVAMDFPRADAAGGDLATAGGHPRPELQGRPLPLTASRIAIEEDHTGRITITSESGDGSRSATGLILAAASVLGLLLIVSTPFLRDVDGIGLLAVVGAVAGGALWWSYRPRRAEVVIAAGDVTVRSWAVKEGEVMLAYSELEHASVETGVERTAPQPAGTIIKAISGYDVLFATRAGRSYLAGLRASDRKQAQWVAGHVNRRIAAAKP